MIVEINGKKIPLVNKNVMVAKKTLKNFIDISEKKSEELGSPLYKYTLYIIGYIFFSEKIKEISPEMLESILKAVEKAET